MVRWLTLILESSLVFDFVLVVSPGSLLVCSLQLAKSIHCYLRYAFHRSQWYSVDLIQHLLDPLPSKQLKRPTPKYSFDCVVDRQIFPPILWELRPDSPSPYSADEVTLLGSASTPKSTHRFPACTTGRRVAQAYPLRHMYE